MNQRITPDSAGDAPARLRVELGERSYDIVVGVGLIADAARHLNPVLPSHRVAVVTDETVAALYLQPLCGALDAGGIEHCEVILPPGEATKNFGHLERLIDDLLDARIARGDAIVALGGGVIGDLTGFAAAILKRGVDVVQVPTTLLAQVDSSVGGKTAIDTRHGKNLVGAFHQPRLVLADIGVLDSLPAREFRAGLAEVVKYGLIDDGDFFGWLETHVDDLIAGDRAARRHAVLKSCHAKARIVAADERESWIRALLNLGHTFGHALEVETGYGARLLHGEAVAIGMVLAFDLSVRLGHCAAADAARLRALLGSIGLPISPANLLGGGDGTADRLVAHMAQDKKVRDGRVMFVLARGIGDAYLSLEVDLDDVRALLDDALTGRP